MGQMFLDAARAQVMLNDCHPSGFGRLFVQLRCDFARKYHHVYGCVTTSHGVDFFENIVRGVMGESFKEAGEYGDNFRKIIMKAEQELIDMKPNV